MQYVKLSLEYLPGHVRLFGDEPISGTPFSFGLSKSTINGVCTIAISLGNLWNIKPSVDDRNTCGRRFIPKVLVYKTK